MKTKQRRRDSFAKYLIEWEGHNIPIGMSRINRVTKLGEHRRGWYCRFTEAGEAYQKWFGDWNHGGDLSSYMAAKEWLRDARREARSWWKTQERA